MTPPCDKGNRRALAKGTWLTFQTEATLCRVVPTSATLDLGGADTSELLWGRRCREYPARVGINCVGMCRVKHVAFNGTAGVTH